MKLATGQVKRQWQARANDNKRLQTRQMFLTILRKTTIVKLPCQERVASDWQSYTTMASNG